MKPGVKQHTFHGLGVQCVTKKGIKESLLRREGERIDPFQTGFDHANDAQIDLHEVKLCFQVGAALLD